MSEQMITVRSLVDAFSTGQMTSKKWLCENLERLNLNLGIIFLCGGWYATMMMSTKLKFERCISIDIDPSCRLVAETLNRELVMDEWKFKAVTEDIRRVNYAEHLFTFTRANGSEIQVSHSPDTIINTSCEHIENFSAWYASIPAGKLVVLQSNNGFGIEGHINCSNDLAAFGEQTPMSTLLHEGELDLPKYTRYMRIGIK